MSLILSTQCWPNSVSSTKSLRATSSVLHASDFLIGLHLDQFQGAQPPQFGANVLIAFVGLCILTGQVEQVLALALRQQDGQDELDVVELFVLFLLLLFNVKFPAGYFQASHTIHDVGAKQDDRDEGPDANHAQRRCINSSLLWQA